MGCVHVCVRGGAHLGDVHAAAGRGVGGLGPAVCGHEEGADVGDLVPAGAAPHLRAGQSGVEERRGSREGRNWGGWGVARCEVGRKGARAGTDNEGAESQLR